jgi:hypothetical protein
MLCSRFCITTCVRAESSVPISGKASTFPQLDHRRRQFLDLLALARDQLLARPVVDLDSKQAELVEQQRERPGLLGDRIGVLSLGADLLEQRLLHRKDEGRGLRRAEAL